MTIESILIIDDCEDYRDITKTLLSAYGYNVWDARCPHDAWQLLDKVFFDLILCDLHMPFITGERQHEFQTSFHVGINSIKELQDLFPDVPVIGITAIPNCDLYKIRSYLKEIQVVTKPSSREELLTLVKVNEYDNNIDRTSKNIPPNLRPLH